MNSGKEKKRLPKKIAQQVSNILPICYYDEPENAYVMEDGSYLDMVQIVSKDLLNASLDEVQYDCLRFSKFYKTYIDDTKIIAMNFPCVTGSQQQFLSRKMKKEKNPKYKKWLQTSLNEMIFLEKNSTSREFFLMFFSSEKEQHTKDLLSLKSLLASAGSILVKEISPEKKEKIIYKMNNKQLRIHGGTIWKQKC